MVLSGYLHDLGIILHFRKDTTLANIVFLNPQWLTRVMYVILSDEKLQEQNAIFTKSWFMDRLAKEYSPDERNNILLLMQKEEFDLCYRLPHCDVEKFLVPHLLPDISPKQATEWQRIGCLNFRFTYAFMPIGIISRIIVRLNQWIDQNEQCHPLVWKSGVILKRNESRALVVEDIAPDGRRIIDICVCGPVYDSKELLGIIRGEIETLHRQSYKDITVEQNVPCNCAVCKESPNPTLFDAKRLMNHVKAGKREIDCEKIDEAKGITSFRSVPIGALLENVLDTTLAEDHREAGRDYDPLCQIASDLRKLPEAVNNLGKRVDDGLHSISNVVVEGVNKSTKKSVFQKAATFLKPIHLLFAIVVAASAIIVGIKACGQQNKTLPVQSQQPTQQKLMPQPVDTLKMAPPDTNKT